MNGRTIRGVAAAWVLSAICLGQDGAGGSSAATVRTVGKRDEGGGAFTRAFRAAPPPRSAATGGVDGDAEKTGSGASAAAVAPFAVWRGFFGRGPFPVEVPVYAPLLGVAPGYFPSFHAPRSSASVTTIRSDGTRTTVSSRLDYVDAIGAALLDLRSRDEAARLVRDGVARFRERRYLDAADRFRRAIPLAPENGLPRFAHAMALFALGDYDGAAYDIRRGLDLLPDWSRSGQDLGAFYPDPQDLEDHLQALRSHCRIRPDDVEARAVLGYVELFSGDPDAARAAFEAVRAARDDDPLPDHFLREIEAIRSASGEPSGG